MADADWKGIPWGPIALISCILAIILGAIYPLRILFLAIFMISFSIWCILPFANLANNKRKPGLDLLPRAFGLLAVFGVVIYLLLPSIFSLLTGIALEDIPGQCAGYMLWGEGEPICHLYSISPYLGLFVMLNILLFLISGAIWAIKDFFDRRKK